METAVVCGRRGEGEEWEEGVSITVSVLEIENTAQKLGETGAALGGIMI